MLNDTLEEFLSVNNKHAALKEERIGTTLCQLASIDGTNVTLSGKSLDKTKTGPIVYVQQNAFHAGV